MDAILLHCPSHFDFRERPVLSGNATDGIPSSAVFEMYPMGLISIVAKLQANGLKGRIVNLALKMLDDPRLDVRGYLGRLRAPVYGFDLHWMIHAQGTMRVARMVKELHPDAFVVLGGFTASYFAEEILERYPFVDGVMRGDTTEDAFAELVERRRERRPLDGIENLMWRSGDRVVDGGLAVAPERFTTDYSSFPFTLAKMILDSRSLDLRSFMPSGFYLGKPVVPVAFSRGCVHRCVNCGYSSYAMKRVGNRDRLALKDPDAFADEILRVDQSYDFAIRIFGDLRIAGREYATRVLDRLEATPVTSQTWLELFSPADDAHLDRLDRCFESWVCEMAPESADEEVRRRQGRPYGNDALRRCVRSIVARPRCGLLTLWFQVGNGHDTERSIDATVEMCAEMIALDPDKVHAFISPLSPYIDPGSLGFEHPEEHGYELLHPDLASQIRAFEGRTWLSGLNYETVNLSRADIVRLSYDAARRLNEHRRRLGQISREMLRDSNQLLDESEALVGQMERQAASGEPDEAVEARLRDFIARTELFHAKRAQTPVLFQRANPGIFLSSLLKWTRYNVRSAVRDRRLPWRR